MNSLTNGKKMFLGIPTSDIQKRNPLRVTLLSISASDQPFSKGFCHDRAKISN